jgi:hypothetical protein
VSYESSSAEIARNAFSREIEGFRTFDSVQRLGREVYDPKQFAGHPGKINLHSNLPRKSESQVIEEVTKQTGEEYSRIILQRHMYGASANRIRTIDEKE